MGVTREYCPLRRDLENSAWSLAEALNHASSQSEACRRTGDFDSLLASQCEYTEARAELSEARYRLRSHRTEHGC